MQDTSAATFESKDQALSDGGGVSKASNEVRMWLAALNAAHKEEEHWRKEAGDSVEIYRAEDTQKTETYFNILHSNVETTLPAVYNSTPVPDIRRRFNDPGDDSKTVADLLERAISYSLDAYDFDATMRNTLFDGYVAGRGVARVRYVPYFTKGEAEQTEDEPEAEEHKDGVVPPEPGETVAYEEVTCEYVPWKSFRRGPGRTWDDVRWIAFEHFLSREQLKDLNDKLGGTITLDAVVGGAKDEGDKDGSPKSEIFGRACVWEIWDKDTKKVLFLAPSHEAEALLNADDPLKLQGFFPIPRPIQPLATPGNLVPMAPYRAYKNLANELNEITRRIQKLVRQLRVRGIYASSTPDLENILGADDGELVPAPGFEAFMQGAGLEKAIAWWPIEPTVKALAQLYTQREQVKATIYEVTGLSDILRGNTEASETATAQQIKSQWGSLRIQRMQADVARFARDLFRIKAEIIATKFSMQNLMLITGIELMPEAQQQQAKAQLQQAQQQAQMAQQPGHPPQPAPAPPKELVEALKKPSIEKVERILRSDLLRAYKIDIESDSTIRADLTRDKQEISEFIQGTAAYVQAIGPATQEGTVPKPLAIKIFASFARLFRLGKSAEDALDQAEQAADAEAQNPPQQKPDPAMAKVEGELKLKQAQVQADQQGKQADMQLKAQASQQDMQLAQQKMQLEVQKMEMEMQLERERHQHEMQLKTMEAQQKQALAAENHTADLQMRSREHDAKVRQIEAGNMMAVDKHGVEMSTAEAEMGRADEKHKVGIQAMKQKAAQKPAGAK